MMEMNLAISSDNSSECSMKISDINCTLVSQKQTNHVYLLPKTIDVKIDFVQMAIIDFNADNSNLELFKNRPMKEDSTSGELVWSKVSSSG